MTDYTKHCWSCGKDTVFPIKNHHECTECGATWNALPPPSSFDLVIERRLEGPGPTKYRLTRKKSRAKAKAKR